MNAYDKVIYDAHKANLKLFWQYTKKRNEKQFVFFDFNILLFHLSSYGILLNEKNKEVNENLHVENLNLFLLKKVSNFQSNKFKGLDTKEGIWRTIWKLQRKNINMH